jgi:hypothetical protein
MIAGGQIGALLCQDFSIGCRRMGAEEQDELHLGSAVRDLRHGLLHDLPINELGGRLGLGEIEKLLKG